MGEVKKRNKFVPVTTAVQNLILLLRPSTRFEWKVVEMSEF